VHGSYTRLLSKRLVPVLLGYDPLLQLLHPEDAIEAATLALEREPAGIVNVVPSGSLTLLTALHLAEKVTLPVPHPAAYPLVDLLWGSGVGEAPSGFIDYARFPCVADGEKARTALGFQARHSSRDALEAFVAYRFPGSRRIAATAGGVRTPEALP
jgi:UDP-glucose 4-epimerase